MKTRHKVFETNSSSTHAIALSLKETKFDNNYYRDQDNNLIIQAKDFGWEFAKYTDVNTKLSYIYIYIRDWVEEKLKDTFFEKLKSVIQENTECQGYKFVHDEDDWVGKGYIDHQSVESKNFHDLFKTKGKLKNFLFNKKSILETSNDNEDGDKDFQSGISYTL